MLERVEKYIVENGLLNKGDNVVVGVSGGPDSVCLLHILHTLCEKWGLTLTAAHLNHQIRPEADGDEEYVRLLCESLNIPFAAKKVDIPALSKLRGISEELCGREERYKLFAEVAKETGANKIAVAHNKNDLAETVLMWLIRGSGSRGLSGISPVRDLGISGEGKSLKIIRPLLDCERQDIEKYCEENSLSPRVDKTNLLPLYLRNKIRLSLLPELMELNPNFLDTVSRGARVLAAEDDFLDSIAKEEYKRLISPTEAGVSLDLPGALNLHEAVLRRVLRLCLPDMGAFHTGEILKFIKRGGTGKRLQLPGGYFARHEYGRFYIEKEREEYREFEYPLPRSGEVYIPEIDRTIMVGGAEGTPIKAPEGAAITVRQRREGDTFQPEGGKGTKKIKEYFIDEKIPRRERGAIPIITVDGEVALICGYRRDRRFVPKAGDEFVRISVC